MNIQFTVPGIPVPQGSLRAFVRGGRAVVTSDNGRLRPWRDAVAWHAREAIASPIEGPVDVHIGFILPRPAGHFGKRGLRPSAPLRPGVKPDLDKLVRAILDALTEAGAWRDDAQVCSVAAWKAYGDVPQAHVSVSTFEPLP